MSRHNQNQLIFQLKETHIIWTSSINTSKWLNKRSDIANNNAHANRAYYNWPMAQFGPISNTACYHCDGMPATTNRTQMRRWPIIIGPICMYIIGLNVTKDISVLGVWLYSEFAVILNWPNGQFKCWGGVKKITSKLKFKIKIFRSTKRPSYSLESILSLITSKGKI